MPKKLMTQTEYANHAGISQPMVHKHIKSGKIPTVKDGKYKKIDPVVADEILKHSIDPAQKANSKILQNNSSPAPVNIKQNKVSFEQARTINEVLKAELNKIKLAIEQGKYIEAEKVEADWFKIGRQIRDSIEAIPVRVAALVAAESDQFKVQQILESEFKNILNEIKDKI